jgi:hypothetical protein
MERRFKTIEDCKAYVFDKGGRHGGNYGGPISDEQLEYFFRSLADLVQKRVRSYLADFVVDIFDFKNRAKDSLLPAGMWFVVKETGTYLWGAAEKFDPPIDQMSFLENTDVYFIDVHKLHYLFRDHEHWDFPHYSAYHDEQDEEFCCVYKIC